MGKAETEWKQIAPADSSSKYVDDCEPHLPKITHRR
jgi:hypothetical protein